MKNTLTVFSIIFFIVAFSKATFASCEIEMTSSCDTATSATDFYNDLKVELANLATDCGSNCETFKTEILRVNKCMEKVISFYNTKCAMGLNSEDRKKLNTDNLEVAALPKK